MNKNFTTRTVTLPLMVVPGPFLKPGLGMGHAGQHLVAGSLPTGPEYPTFLKTLQGVLKGALTGEAGGL